MISTDSQNFDSYVPVYDVAPEEWEEARPFIVEQLKVHANAINSKEVGFFLDVELLSGKAFIPGSNEILDGGSSQQFRTIFRKVITFPGLTIGLNTQPHGIFIDGNFSLIQMFGAATNATALTGEPLPNGADTISYTGTNVLVTVAAAYTRAWVVMEYIFEL
jgi:hypothetical protein